MELQKTGILFTAADASGVARAARRPLHVSEDDAARVLDVGARRFYAQFLLERRNPTSPAEIARWAADVEKAACKLRNVLDRVQAPWLDVMADRHMPAEERLEAVRLIGELPTIAAAYGTTWLHAVGQRLVQEHRGRRGRRSTATIGLTAFVQFTDAAYRELFGKAPKLGSITELVGHDDADGGRQRFKHRDSPYIRFMKATARHLAVQVRADDREMAAALRRWTKGDTLADKARSMPREQFARKSLKCSLVERARGDA
jgi:hypothetical protein